jgi:hypothetical protein
MEMTRWLNFPEKRPIIRAIERSFREIIGGKIELDLEFEIETTDLFFFLAQQ